MTGAIPKRLQAALLRIRGDHPFFGTLALFADFQVTAAVATAATDGKTLFFNPEFVEKLDAGKLCGLISHELMHAALLHTVRRREREPLTWNIAADIVVNAMIRTGTDYPLPEGAVEDPSLAHLSVEEVYEQLARTGHKLPTLGLMDLLSPPVGGGIGSESDGGALAEGEIGKLQRQWRGALQQAGAVVRRTGKGFGREGLEAVRDIQNACEPQVDWRSLLWQFVVATPFDFAGFDRRFVHRGLYLEDMVGESIEVAICIDTSGSIGGVELDSFYGEIRGILDAYPHIRGQLFFADANLYGPHEFSASVPMPKARGGGGTDFVPFFDWIARRGRNDAPAICIYFTDGYGSFPAVVPGVPVLWVVSSGGLQSSGFPFGTVARMIDEPRA
jgi:predicted metal-dependent peptidase